MNRYSIWLYVVIATVVALGAFYAAPNLYEQDPSLQISQTRGLVLTETVEKTVSAALTEAGLVPKAIEQSETRMLIRFNDTQTQLKAREVVQAALGGDDYSVALNLAPSTPGFLKAFGGKPMYLGLDLRGGVHFLMEVDMQGVNRQAEERFISDIKTALRGDDIRYLPMNRSDAKGITMRFRSRDDRNEARGLIQSQFVELDLHEVEKDFGLVGTIRPEVLEETRKLAIDQNITTLRSRVNELGVSEPIIQQQGLDRVVLQLPGVQDAAEARMIIGATATLEFRMVDLENDVRDALAGNVPVRSKLYFERDGAPQLLHKDIMLTGEYIIDARSGIDQQTGSPNVNITLNSKGASIFAAATQSEIGRPMATVYIEPKTETIRNEAGELEKHRTIKEEVINVATIRDILRKRFQITGLDSSEEARSLALLLRAGSLAAPIEIIEERTVGPSLGQDNIDRGFRSVQIGFVLVLIFMAFYYRAFGLIADFGLALNLVLLIALMSRIQATLTVPGIAGIVLTVGMAVDANVLIFERIREELRNGNSPQASIHAGYERAFSTIADANITTLIAALVLLAFGTGPILGFAVTLSLGIITSMFTAILGTRAVVNLVFGGRRMKNLPI